MGVDGTSFTGDLKRPGRTDPTLLSRPGVAATGGANRFDPGCLVELERQLDVVVAEAGLAAREPQAAASKHRPLVQPPPVAVPDRPERLPRRADTNLPEAEHQLG